MQLSRFHQRLTEKTADRSAAPAVIVAYGDSVTEGWGYDSLMGEEVFHAQLVRLLRATRPLAVMSVINAGAGGESASDALRRLDRDVLRRSPDLVLVEFGLNDAAGGGLEGLDRFTEAMRTIVGRIRNETKADVVLMTPNMMPTRESDSIPEQYRHLLPAFLRFQSGGVLAAYAQRIREIAAAEGVAVADVYAEWERLAARGEDVTAMLANGLNHPDARGHRLAADLLLAAIQQQ